MFPAEYLGTMGSGCGIGGLLPSIINIALIGVSQNSAKVIGLACFCICTALTLSSLGLSFILQKNTFYQFYGSSKALKKKSVEEVIYVNTKNLYHNLRFLIHIHIVLIQYSKPIFRTKKMTKIHTKLPFSQPRKLASAFLMISRFMLV